ncbi:hypothetical protein CBM2592_B100199 [Cupriavidus taiwanensis]|nr:hypothetical protein CBM2592_B100199 [Cupriavidus taiwanensis]
MPHKKARAINELILKGFFKLIPPHDGLNP